MFHLIALALAAAQPSTPPPGWDIGNTCAKDVTTENGLESASAAYVFCQALQRDERRHLLCHGPTENIPDDDPALVLYTEGTLEQREFDLISDRTEACDVSETTQRRIHWVTLQEICPFADAAPGETVLVTDEINEPLVCPPEPETAP